MGTTRAARAAAGCRSDGAAGAPAVCEPGQGLRLADPERRLAGTLHIMQHYEKALALTRDMLEAAQKSDWERLTGLERERATLIDQLRDLDREPSPDTRERERKRELLREIMQSDEQIEILTRDWMRELREVLGSISAEQRLSRTYGT